VARRARGDVHAPLRANTLGRPVERIDAAVAATIDVEMIELSGIVESTGAWSDALQEFYAHEPVNRSIRARNLR
jgi:hypothetical protein